MSQNCLEKLPEDIWRTVFELTGDGVIYFPTAERAHKVPLILAVVCSRWRQIVLDMPGLWRNLVLTRRLRIDALQDVQVLLARARQMPRSLTVFTRKRPVIPNLVLDLIAPYRYRRLILSLHREEVEALARLFILKPQWTSGLQELALYKCQKSQFTIPFALFPPDAQLSELTSLKLKVYQTIDTQFLVHANSWYKLRHLHMSTRVAARCAFEVVRHCSATLETCHLVLDRDVAFAARAPSLNDHVLLPTLQALAITFYDGQDVEPFIRPCLPTLRRIALCPSFSTFQRYATYRSPSHRPCRRSRRPGHDTEDDALLERNHTRPTVAPRGRRSERAGNGRARATFGTALRRNR
ncbi:hypothetical protein AX14_011158 [Amanita brunnescens Koide BX004]|nr:hypothetical protein AX14_011158 [Amanita brunnescens Koide BX004]